MYFIREFINYITSPDYFLTIEQSLNQSFLYESPLSNILFDLNRIAYNKPHFWMRTIFERLALVFDPSQSVFLWTIPIAFMGFIFSYKKLSTNMLKIVFLFLLFAALKGKDGWVIFLPWLLYFQVSFLIIMVKKYVIQK